MLTLFLMTVFKLVFKWSSLLLFHVHRSTCVPEIMNCSNRDFNLGLEAWSFMTPWSSSNSLLLPTGPHLPHPVVQALLLLLLWQLHCLSLFFFFLNVILLAKSWTTFLRGQMSTQPVQVKMRTAGLPLLTSTSSFIFSGTSGDPPWGEMWEMAESYC